MAFNLAEIKNIKEKVDAEVTSITKEKIIDDFIECFRQDMIGEKFEDVLQKYLIDCIQDGWKPTFEVHFCISDYNSYLSISKFRYDGIDNVSLMPFDKYPNLHENRKVQLFNELNFDSADYYNMFVECTELLKTKLSSLNLSFELGKYDFCFETSRSEYEHICRDAIPNLSVFVDSIMENVQHPFFQPLTSCFYVVTIDLDKTFSTFK